MADLLDLIYEDLVAEERKIPDHLYPSQASAYLPCKECEGSGLVPVPATNPTKMGSEKCPACKGEKVQLVGPCMRKLYWQYRGEPITNPTDLAGYIKMAIGNGIEEWLTKRLKLALAAFDQQPVRCTKFTTRMISGRADAFYIDPESNDVLILLPLEIKSSTDRWIKKIKSGGDIPPAWWLQMVCYLMMAKLQWPWFDPPNAVFIGIGRDNGYHTQINVPVSWNVIWNVFQAIVARWVELENWLSVDQELPPPEWAEINDGYTKYPCTYCYYRDKCQECGIGAGGTDNGEG